MKLEKISLSAIIIIITLFLLINVDIAFGEMASVAKNILIVYMLMIAVLTGLFDLKIPSISIMESWKFLVGFFLTAIFVWVIPQLFVASIHPIVTALSFGFLYAFVIAFSEEIIFRYLLPKQLGFGDIISNILFGVFHASVIITMSIIAYGQIQITTVLAGMFFLMFLGFLWAKMRDYTGILGSTGSHFAYNLYTYGILAMLIGVG